MVRMTPPTCSALPEPRPGVTRVAEYCMMREKPCYKTMASPTPHCAFNTSVACSAHTVSVPPPGSIPYSLAIRRTPPPSPSPLCSHTLAVRSADVDTSKLVTFYSSHHVVPLPPDHRFPMEK